MSSRKLSLALCTLLLAAAVPAFTEAGEDERGGPRPYLVFAHVEGVRVVDDYGAFVTALLSGSDVAALRAQGVLVEPLDVTFYRGAWAIQGSDDAAVPPGLRAGPDEPFYVVQFRGPVKAAWRDALAEQSLRVYDSVPHFAFLAKLLPAQAQTLGALPEVAFVGPHHPAYKLSPELPAEGIADVAILAFPGEPLAPVAAQVVLSGGSVRSMTTSFPLDGIVKATLPAENIADLARVPAVSWIEPAYDGITLDNAQSSAITQTGTLTSYKVHDKGVDGSSQVLSVCDTGVKTRAVVPGAGSQGTFPVKRMNHEMYDDPAHPLVIWMLPTSGNLTQHRKMQAYYAPIDIDAENLVGGDFDDTSGHGTHTAGTIAGDAPPYGQRNGNDGVAYAARLMACDITFGGSFYIANDYSNYWNPAYGAGARVNSNSWGSPHTTSYTEKARQHDLYVWEHRDFVITRSMGNTGQNTIRPEAVAKSALGIGATNNGAGMESLASFSSRGPAQDGRIKPNVVAPGNCLVSAGTGTSNYVCLAGTSMSTPTAAGAAGLVRDYFVKGFYPSGSANGNDALNPSSALVRGVLELSGKRITGSLAGTGFPNGNQGWGRVLLDDALHFAGDGRKLLAVDESAGNNLTTGDERSFGLSVAAGQPLRVMLAWSDRAAAAGANPALVNDLDLVVTGPLGTYLGNAFVDGEVPPNQGARDARNVEEAVYIGSPAAGAYTVTVRATSVPDGPQTFALVAAHG